MAPASPGLPRSNDTKRKTPAQCAGVFHISHSNAGDYADFFPEGRYLKFLLCRVV